MGRAPCCAKVGLKRGRWTAEEDEILVKYIAANGEGSWRTLPKNAGLLRCGKSCRLRWINYLRAGVKRGDISKEEEETILKLHVSMGNRWSLIASHLPGRTDNEIKNYWNSHLGRRVHSFRRIAVDGAPSVVVDVGKAASSSKQRGGRTSRSAMKKKSTNGVSTDRRVKQEKGAAVLPTSSSVHSDLGCSMVFDLGYQQENCVTLEGLDGGMLGPSGETEAGLISPSQVGGSGLWPINDMEGGLFHAGEDSVGWGSHEERESGVMSSSEERELGGLAFNGGRDGGPLALEGGCGVALGEEEVGSAQVGKMLDWDMGLGAKLWDDEVEMWPWPWESENVGLELQGMEGSGPKEESLASWLLF